MKLKVNPALKIVLTIVAFCLILFGWMGFMISASYSMGKSGVDKYYEQYPLNDVNGIAVDSAGDIYIGEGQTGSIQVYNSQGNFKYGFSFPTGGAGWFAFGIEHDKIHIVTARTDSYFVFSNGELVYSEKEIDYNHSEELQKKYHMTENYSFATSNKTYRILQHDTVSIKDSLSGQVEKVHLNVPFWPFSIDTFWGIGAFGMVLMFALHHEVFFSMVKFKKRNKHRSI
jgi:hypothetical protein